MSQSPPANSPSNPVAPTTFVSVNGDASAPPPVAAPVARAEAVADALAAAARALAAAADALRGGDVAGASHSLTCHPGPGPGLSGGVTHRGPGVHVGSLTVREAVNEFLVAKARAGRSDRYLRQLRVSLSSFARGRAVTELDAVTLADVERWLYGQDWSARTMRGYLADVRTLFHFAVRRGYAAGAGACAVELPGISGGGDSPGIHTAAEVTSVLEAARRADLDVCRHLAVRYFAGVRSAEAHRLREENLKIEAGCVEIPAAKAKTRRRRLVVIQPALAAWLALGGVLRALSPDSVRRVIRASGVAWPANVTRHTFCSHHLAAFENAGKTALEAGHSEAVLFAHYRALVMAREAAAFWGLRPARWS